MLPVQILPANDCISKVLIPTAYHPGNFYVIPEKGWKCLCKVPGDIGSDVDGMYVLFS